MNTFTREMEMCYGHRLLNYESKCRFLHGHTGRVVLKIRSDGVNQDQLERMCQQIESWIKQNLDHCMLLNRADPVVPVLQEMGERITLLDVNPTAESIARTIFDHAVSEGIPVIEVGFWESTKNYATYRR